MTMRLAPAWKMAAAGVVLLALLAAGGCRKKEAPPAGEAEPINLNALNEIANYKEALEEFAKAYKLQPLPALLYNIGRCQESLGNLKAAVASYREYLEKDKQIADRGTIEARIANLEKRIKPAEPPTPPPAEPKTTPPATEATPEATDTGPRWRRPAGWAVLGVGAASLVVGIVGGVMVKKKNDEYTEGAAATGNKTYAELQQIADSGKSWQSAEIASLVVGGVLAAAGGGLLIWDALSKGRRSEQALRLAPFVSAAGFGLAGAARF